MISFPDMIQRMAIDLGSLPSQLVLIIKTAPLRYKKFYIPKRDGSPREVAQPAREVKAIQRWLINELTVHLPIHESVTAYQEGMSIRRNAQFHVSNNYLLKMDLQNFFPSITADDMLRHLQHYCGKIYDPLEQSLIVKACTWAPSRMPPLRLCIGAPSSPLLSNSIMYEIDCQISEIALNDGVTYTRYADDLTFSCKKRNVLSYYPDNICQILSKINSPKLSINMRKTVHASRAGRRIVTGVVLTPDRRLSVGRERKRLVRSMYHRYILGLLNEEEKQTLSGLLAFIDCIEPGYSQRLKGRYQV